MSDGHIRFAVLADAEPISALLKELSPFFLASQDDAHAAAYFEHTSAPRMRENIAGRDRAFLVAEVDGEFAGFIALKDWRHVVQFFVAPRFQKVGVGGALWQRALAEIRRQGPPQDITVRASVFAVPVYGRFGFEITGERTTQKGLTFVPMVLRAGGA
jgi:GNAT superfamily N-acetyltransferase